METINFWIKKEHFKSTISSISENSFFITINKKTIQANIYQWNQRKKIITFEIDNKLYKAKILNQQNNQLSLFLFHENLEITIDSKNPSFNKKTISKPFINKTIVSPLAGRIIKIHINAKQHVVTNQPLVTIESMKMENEIRAPFNLFIKSIPIKEGHLVKINEVLVNIEKPK